MGRYNGKTCRLSTMLVLTGSFFLTEIIVGYVTNSIALVADSFHMLSDVVALIVGFASVRISKWPSKRNTYGWVRAEILGALVNAVFLLALCFSILVEAIKRIVIVEDVENPKLLLIVGIVGLVINLIGLVIFGHHGHSHGGGGHGHSHGGKGKKGQGHSHQHYHDDGGSHGHSHGQASLLRNQPGGDNPHKEAAANGHGIVAAESEKLVANHHRHGTEGSCGAAAAGNSITGDPCVFTMHDHQSGTDITVDLKKHELASASQLNMRGVFLHVLGDALGSVIVIISAIVLMTVKADWKHYFDPAGSVLMVIIILATAIPLLKESAFILLQTVPSHVDVESIIKELEQMEGIYGVHECHIWQLAGNRIVASAHIRCHGIEEYMELASRIKHLFHNAGIHSTTIQPEFIDWQEAMGSDRTCALVCPPDDGICAPATCCGDKDLRPRKTQNLAEANQNNSNNADDDDNDVDNAEGDDVGELVTVESHVNQSMTRNQQAVAPFASTHSLDVKFSRDGDEVVLEMSDLPHAESMASRATK
ncbi:hypothetical protein EGW08_002349 [Elysia chlorotica]|uniref:Zinc transporter 1 n=1 Tax=Elysia chlorotica TaxID=188477 RepID=A0A433U7W4_ELYCH|nr:hypothetical protein EGW08_002349 [Elysia chlorotica]